MRINIQTTDKAAADGVLVFQNDIIQYDADFLSSPVTTTPTLSIAARSIEFWNNTVDDLKSIRWRHIFGQIAIQILLLITVAVLIWVIVRSASPLTYWNSACTPDGTFEISANGYNEYNPWRQGAVFTINIAFGRMGFSTAKGIDVLWDFVFGRGVQGLLAVITYKVYTKSLSRLMESTPVTLRTFEAITLQSDSIYSLCKLIRDAIRNHGIRAKFIIAWIVASSTFLLAFQTIASAMTGYSASLSAFVQTNTGERVLANLFQPVQYVIHDGSRLNGSFYDDYPVVLGTYTDPTTDDFDIYATSWSVSEVPTYQISSPCSQFAPLTDAGDFNNQFNWKGPGDDESFYADCMILWHMSEYVYQYGFLGLNDTTSVFNNSGVLINLPSPSLNVTAYFGAYYYAPTDYPWSTLPYGYYWTDPTGQQPFKQANEIWAFETVQYNISSLNEYGTCQQEDLNDIQYQWGFSSVMLSIFGILTLFWVIGIYAMYMDAHMNSALVLSGRDVGLKRAVLDVQSTMKDDLDGLDNSTVDKMGNSELHTLIKNRRLDYVALASAAGSTRNGKVSQWRKEFSTRRWVMDEMFWLIMFLFLSIMLILSFQSWRIAHWWHPLLAPIPWLGNLIVLIIGRNHASRWIWFMLLFVAFWAINISFMVYWVT